jgi:hypothetical protein
MTKTNAEIQKSFRKRKKESEYGEKRFETWISYDTQIDIERLARATGKNKKQIMEAAIVALRVSVLSGLDENSREDYYRIIER